MEVKDEQKQPTKEEQKRLRKRNLTDEERMVIVCELFGESQDGELPHGTLKKMAEKFHYNTSTIRRLWLAALKGKEQGNLLQAVQSNIKNRSGRKPSVILQVEEKVRNTPLEHRANFRSLSRATGLSLATLHKAAKQGILVRTDQRFDVASSRTRMMGPTGQPPKMYTTAAVPLPATTTTTTSRKRREKKLVPAAGTSGSFSLEQGSYEDGQPTYPMYAALPATTSSTSNNGENEMYATTNNNLIFASMEAHRIPEELLQQQQQQTHGLHPLRNYLSNGSMTSVIQHPLMHILDTNEKITTTNEQQQPTKEEMTTSGMVRSNSQISI